jgi:hypothetical protein
MNTGKRKGGGYHIATFQESQERRNLTTSPAHFFGREQSQGGEELVRVSFSVAVFPSLIGASRAWKNPVKDFFLAGAPGLDSKQVRFLQRAIGGLDPVGRK